MEKTSTCPKCNYLSTDEEFSICPKCGIIIKKYYDTLETRQKLEAERLEREKKIEEEAKLKAQQDVKRKKANKKGELSGKQIIIYLIPVLFLLIYIYSSEVNKHVPTNDAIELVKSKIPSDNKTRMWYISDWTKKSINSNLWEVTVSDGRWKVSNGEKICSETGGYVSVCSVNGTAKRYSDIPFCKPSSICTKKH